MLLNDGHAHVTVMSEVKKNEVIKKQRTKSKLNRLLL